MNHIPAWALIPQFKEGQEEATFFRLHFKGDVSQMSRAMVSDLIDNLRAYWSPDLCHVCDDFDGNVWVEFTDPDPGLGDTSTLRAWLSGFFSGWGSRHERGPKVTRPWDFETKPDA